MAFFPYPNKNKLIMNFKNVKEVSLYVQDLERSRLFYEQKLKMKVVSLKEGRHLFLKAGSTVLLCFLAKATVQDQTLPPHGGNGEIHIAFEVAKQDYQSTRAAIEAEGIEIIQDFKWGENLESFYFRDPDGHLLEVIEEKMWGF